MLLKGETGLGDKLFCSDDLEEKGVQLTKDMCLGLMKRRKEKIDSGRN